MIDGRDIVQAVTERALRGVDVHRVEDSGWAPSGGGEVHYTTSAVR